MPPLTDNLGKEHEVQIAGDTGSVVYFIQEFHPNEKGIMPTEVSYSTKSYVISPEGVMVTRTFSLNQHMLPKVSIYTFDSN